MQISFVLLMALAVASVAAHMRLEVTTAGPTETGKIDDIMNVVLIEAETTEEKEILMTNVKSMIENITKVAEGAVAVLKTNEELLNKVVNAIDSAKEMLEDRDDFGAMELMQTILISKIQDIMEKGDVDKSIHPQDEGVSPAYYSKNNKKVDAATSS